MRPNAVHLILPLMAVLAGASTVFSQDITPPPDDLLKKFIQTPTTPEELKPIIQARDARDFKKVVDLATGIIDRPLSSYVPIADGPWFRSTALMDRADAENELNVSFDVAMADEREAADLGNLEAIGNVLSVLFDVYSGNALPSQQTVHTDATEIQKFLLMGANLGDASTAILIGLNRFPTDLSEDEKLYWLMLGIMRDNRSDSATKISAIKDLSRQLTAERLERVLSKYSLVRGSITAVLPGLPRRGLFGSLFVESDLRGTYARNFGFQPRLTSKPPEAVTIQENWRLLRYLGNTDSTDAYMVVPGKRKFDDPNISSLPLDTIISNIQPGDRVFVRCGPMSHVAMVYRIDLQHDAIYFADSAYQFWQVNEGSYIKSFNLVEHDFHRFLSQIPISDLRGMLEAVITIRDSARAPNKTQ